MTKLPDYVSFKHFDGSPLRDLFPAAGDDLLELLGSLLTINPSKRCSCTQGLKMAYFRWAIIRYSKFYSIIGNKGISDAGNFWEDGGVLRTTVLYFIHIAFIPCVNVKMYPVFIQGVTRCMTLI